MQLTAAVADVRFEVRRAGAQLVGLIVVLGGCSATPDGGDGLDFDDPSNAVGGGGYETPPDPSSTGSASPESTAAAGPGSTGGDDGDASSTASMAASCAPGELRACYSGDPATQDVGDCQAGTQTCTPDGVWRPCEDEVLPLAEACNGVDDDCDGVADNDDPGGGTPCNTGVPGPCADGVVVCQGAALVCAQVVQPQLEICGDGIDNDCNGTPDDACTCNPLGPAPVCGAGFHCLPTPTGVTTCDAPIGVGVQYTPCLVNADCAAAFQCAETAFLTSYCMAWCASNFDCTGQDLCLVLNPPVYAGAVEHGLCYDGLP